MNPALHSSKFHGHRTPEKILSRVRMLGPIGLDPCTQPDNPVGARVFYTQADDGLTKVWWPNWREVLFVNPPYGRALKPWTQMMAGIWGHTRDNPDGAHGVLLVPSRTDTRWWHDNCLQADARCEIEGRLRFLTPEGVEQGPAPFPSALFYWGPAPDKFIDVFSDIGYGFRQH